MHASTNHPAAVLYPALSPRAPAYVHAPSIALMNAEPQLSRSELLRLQIVAAQQTHGRKPRWR